MKTAAPVRLCLALLSMAVTIAHADTKANEASKTHIVTMENMKFEPQSLTVRRGDRVVWVNKDLFPHTATANSHQFDSGNIAPQASWTYVTSQDGTFEYSCVFHPTMKATLIVR
jgi:plastocyanin